MTLADSPDRDSPRPLLQAEGLSKSFGGVRAVRDISMQILEGATFALIGPNGAGKSTTLNLLSGVYSPDHGSIRFRGEDIGGLALHSRVHRGIARTFQKIRLFNNLTVLENVLAGFHSHHAIPLLQYLIPGAALREDHDRFQEEAYQLLEFVGIAPRAKLRAGALAYGEQRMLEVARALATRPKLLMLDEPAAGLNPMEVEFLVDRLRQLSGRGVTLLVVEHNMDLVMNIATHVFVMNHGEYLADGTPAEVQQNADVVAAYLGTEVS